MAQSKQAFHEAVAEKLIEKLKEGTAPWQKPWQPGESGSFMPFNPTTGNRYKGINAIQLMSQGYSDQRWMTYNQAQAADAQVRKGEKGTPIQYWKFNEEQVKRTEDGKPVLDEKGTAVKEVVALERPRMFFATVFNAEQIDGLPAIQARKQQDWNAVERAEEILQASGAVIRHGEQNRAFYRPATDSIHLPGKEQFPTAGNYYATALHELGHWTGHESRLNRDLAHPFGSEGYAKEELRAEIASMILGDEIGIGHDPEQHAAYVGSWIKALQDDPLEIFRAAADAEKIQGFVLGLQLKQEQERTHEENMQVTVDVRLEDNEYENAAKQARIHEENVRNDPNSTSEDISAAREARKDADLAAVTNDADLQRRVAEFERQSQLAGAVTKDTDTHAKKNIAGGDSYTATTHVSGQSADLESKTFISVPFKQKEEAKALGAKWDRQQESWYVPANIDVSLFAKWTQSTAAVLVETTKTVAEAESEAKNAKEQRRYLAVPFGEHMAAKAVGAMWDKAAKSWYAGPNADMAKLDKWSADKGPTQGPAMRPQEEFAEALRSLGCIVDGSHPVMDGARHRIPVQGDKKGEQAGFYVGHLDGHPAGYIKNNKTGIEMKWKSKGYALDPELKAQLQGDAAAKLASREAEQNRLQEQTAQRIGRQMLQLVPVVAATAYMQAKGILPQPGVLTDREGQKTYIPATDTNGKQWTMQYIQEDGTKRFAKDSRKEGCFHAVGGLDGLAKAPVLVISEGYATAGSLSQSLGFATVAAFDSGNLLAVAKALHEKFPDKPIIIAGDDDRHLQATQGVNPGRTKAEEAAKAVGGKALLPIFAPGEQAANPKGFTDFNDLANKSEFGQQGIDRQVGSIVESLIEKHQLQKTERQQERMLQHDMKLRRTASIS